MSTAPTQNGLPYIRDSVMARAVVAHDWAGTSLGPIEGWPQSLRVAVGICLNSRFPMFVWWGAERVNIYNDAYVPILGARHPSALGRPARSIWGEIWDVVGPQAERVIKEGTPSWNERVHLRMERHGFPEDTWFTWSYSAIPDDSGGIGGMFCACVEETSRVVMERERDSILRDLQSAQSDREQVLRELEAERGNLAEVIEKAPSFICILRGPEFVFELVNEQYKALVGEREVLGRPLRLALPELVGQGFVALLEDVARTGIPYVGNEVPVRLNRSGKVEERSLSFVYQPLRGDTGKINGVFVHGVDVTDLVASREAARASGERFRTLFNSMDEGFAVHDVIFEDGKPVDVRFFETNPAFIQQTGLPEPKGRSLREMGVALEPEWFEVYGKVALTGEGVRFERQAGQLGRWFEVYAYKVGGAESSRVGVLFNDISERKRAEAELRAGREREDRQKRLYEAILGNTPDLAYVWGLDHRFTYANENLLKMWGRTWEEAIGKNCLELGYEPWHAAMHDREIDEVVATRKPLRGEVPFNGAFGRRTYDYILVPVLNAEGEVEAVAGTTRDITEYKRAVAEGERLAHEMRLVTDAMPALVSYVDSSFTYRFANKGYMDWFGKPREELEGKDARAVLGEAMFERLRPHMEQALSGKRVVFGEAARGPDGEPRHFRAEYTPDVRPDGSIPGYYAMVVDVTEQKRAEQDRERLLATERAARTEAERAGKLKDEFLATLSHELRTPLNAVMGWAQLLRKHAGEDETLRDGLEVIERNSRLQSQLIADLLDMSRIISGKMRLDVQKTDLVAVIGAAVESLRPAAEAKEVQVASVLAPIDAIQADPARLQQVVWNLLSNAVKFTGRGGWVRVTLARVDSHIEIAVGDSGIGIGPEFLPFVFERFRQADSSTSREHGGLGLGLSIVKQLTELHGGTVQVQSAGKGQGATFTVKLPLGAVREGPAESEAPARRPERPALAELPDLGGVRVLVVDDEPDARDVVRQLLENAGARVLTAGSADEALVLVGEHELDLLLSDIGMPVRDGYSFIQEVRQRGVRTPAAALTAFARSEDRTKALRAGFQTHIAKPVDAVELLATVAALMGRRVDQGGG